MSLKVEGHQTSPLETSGSVNCSFNGTEVPGLVLDNETVLCVSPSLSRTGQGLFQITAQDFTAETTFTSGRYNCICAYMKAKLDVLIICHSVIYTSR